MWEWDYKENWAQKNWVFWTVVLEKTLEGPLDRKEIKPANPKGSHLNIHWKDWRWSSNSSATWCKEPTHWKRPWCWKRLRAREGGNRGLDSWMASSTQRTWVWANSGRWGRTGAPSVLQYMGLQSQTRLSEQQGMLPALKSLKKGIWRLPGWWA